jgi:acyl-CoA synthetase (AMP-forming)/AMP-acid ligase II
MTTLQGPPLGEAAGIGALTMGGFLDEVGERFAGNEALVFDDPLRGGATVRWTYAGLRDEARRVGRALIAAGIGKGNRVGILMGSRPEAVASLFGAAMAGAVAVPLSTFSPKPELAFLFEHSDASILITQTALLGRRFADDALELCGDARPSAPYPFLQRLVSVGDGVPAGVQPWDDFLASGDAVDEAILDARIAQTSPADHGLIIYSSGTTSQPKGVLHNHRSPTLQFWIQSGIFLRHERTRMWTALPMFWTAGLNTAMGATLAAGGCWVMQESFEPGEAIALMAREGVTEPYALPHQYAAREEHPDWATADLSSVTCAFGKSAFARHPKVQPDTGWNMPVGYGLSETCAFFVAHRADAGREAMKRSIGRLLPGNELRVVDPDTGRVLGPNEDGELLLRGPTLMEHYVKKTREESVDADGFFATGDVGFFDDDGEIHFTGRRTEMIKTGGANVSPAELEVALRACKPVKLARIIGVPDPRLDQLVVACIVLQDGVDATEDDIRSFLRERVAAYKVPKRVLFFADGEIPMTGSGTKVRDPELAALVEARLRQEPSRR